jgi:alkanesulfonate monooxygenase
VSLEFLWYIPNTVEAGHRGDDEANQWTSLNVPDHLTGARTSTVRSNDFDLTVSGDG